MYRLIDGAAMGSSLDPALANVFVSCNEERFFGSSLRLQLYCRYIDDIILFSDEVEADQCISSLMLSLPKSKFYS